jgi:hypothetical protein
VCDILEQGGTCAARLPQPLYLQLREKSTCYAIPAKAAPAHIHARSITRADLLARLLPPPPSCLKKSFFTTSRDKRVKIRRRRREIVLIWPILWPVYFCMQPRAAVDCCSSACDNGAKNPQHIVALLVTLPICSQQNKHSASVFSMVLSIKFLCCLRH